MRETCSGLEGAEDEERPWLGVPPYESAVRPNMRAGDRVTEWAIGIIGGSGLYQIDGLEDAQWIAIDTPWGKPSDELLLEQVL